MGSSVGGDHWLARVTSLWLVGREGDNNKKHRGKKNTFAQLNPTCLAWKGVAAEWMVTQTLILHILESQRSDQEADTRDVMI